MRVGFIERCLVCNGPPVFSVACFVFVTYLRGEGWLLTCSLCDYTCCFGGFVDLPPPLARGGRPATLPPGGGGSHICTIWCTFRQGAGRALHPWAVSANFVHCRFFWLLLGIFGCDICKRFGCHSACISNDLLVLAVLFAEMGSDLACLAGLGCSGESSRDLAGRADVCLVWLSWWPSAA